MGPKTVIGEYRGGGGVFEMGPARRELQALPLWNLNNFVL